MVQSKIKVYKILSQPRDIREIVLCFDVILSFSLTTQITVAKQTRFVLHSSKRKGTTLYIWSLGITDRFYRACGARCNFRGKTRKTVKCTGEKNPQNRHHCWRKPKTKDKIRENPQTVEDPKTEKPQFLSAKTEKPNQTLTKSAKPKIPTPPSLIE